MTQDWRPTNLPEFIYIESAKKPYRLKILRQSVEKNIFSTSQFGGHMTGKPIWPPKYVNFVAI